MAWHGVARLCLTGLLIEFVVALRGKGQTRPLKSDGSDFAMHSYIRPANTWQAAFPLEITAVYAEDCFGHEKVGTRFTPSDYSAPPRRMADAWFSTGDWPPSLRDRSMYFANANYIGKLWAHPACGRQPRMALEDSDALVFDIQWRLGQGIPETFQLPVHIHADGPWAAPTDVTVHNEISPKNVWQHPDLRCPSDVGRPHGEKNECKYAELLALDDDTEMCDQKQVGCNSNWRNVMCPVGSDGLVDRLDDSDCNMPAVLVSFTTDSGDSIKRLPEKRIPQSHGFATAASRSAKDVCLISAEREVRESERERDEREDANSSTYSYHRCRDHSILCLPRTRVCDDGCLTSLHAPLRVRIPTTELKNFRMKTTRNTAKVSSIRDIEYVSLQLHDNHGVAGNSMDTWSAGSLDKSPAARIYVALTQSDIHDDTGTVACPADEIADITSAEAYEGLVPGDSVSQVLATCSAPDLAAKVASASTEVQDCLRLFVQQKVVEDLVRAAAAFDNGEADMMMTLPPDLRTALLLGNSPFAKRFRAAGWQQVRTFLESVAWTPRIFSDKRTPWACTGQDWPHCIGLLMERRIDEIDSNSLTLPDEEKLGEKWSSLESFLPLHATAGLEPRESAKANHFKDLCCVVFPDFHRHKLPNTWQCSASCPEELM